MEANMKRKLLLCMGAMLLAGTLAAQVPVPEWETGVEQIKSLIKTDPGQASATAGELLKGKNKKNVSLIISIARAYLNVGKLPEAESYLKMAQKVDKKDAGVSVLEGDIALAQKDVGRACQLYEQAIYFNPDCKRKAISPEGGEIAPSANEWITEFLHFAIQLN